jgi:DNA replication protein DnaC
VLLVDDFAMAPLNDGERRSFLEICDDRYGRRSTVLTSQLPVGTRRSATRPSPTASSTGSSTTRIASR